jgi:uncharacterized zinc-type alcohol dehydrogenase-like protein
VGKDGVPTQGGYSQAIVVTEDFVLRIPDGLELDVAAPLLCAGITLYSPLRHWGAGPGTRVAVVGPGRSGPHGRAAGRTPWGAEVTVLSQSLKKQEEGLRLGADHYFRDERPGHLPRLAASFDLILNTVSASIDVDAYLSLLAVDGTMVSVGIPEHPLSLHASSLLMRRVSYAGSNIGGIRETQEMLDFCAEHGIAARRDHRRGAGQRGLRAGAGLRRALPLRDRHGHARLTRRRVSAGRCLPAAGPRRRRPGGR